MVHSWFYWFTFTFKYDSFGIDFDVRCENSFSFIFSSSVGSCSAIIYEVLRFSPLT